MAAVIALNQIELQGTSLAGHAVAVSVSPVSNLACHAKVSVSLQTHPTT